MLLRFKLIAAIALALITPTAAGQDQLRLEIAGSVVEVQLSDGPLELSRAEIQQWIETSAQAMVAYYGKFPVQRLRIAIVPVGGSGVKTGTSYGYGGAAIRISLGGATGLRHLRDDWVMPHEMVHLAFPSVPDTHTWLEEGLATYVEPWARLKIGELNEEKVWADFIEGLPKGLPRAGDQGLDRTHTWGRTYWGGALFCLLADIEIRKRTSNRKSLQDALRAIVAAGGNIEQRWTLERALKTGDSAIGVPVLSELYGKMRYTAVTPDLSALWSDLGVAIHNGAIKFDDAAPLAHIRRAMAKQVISNAAGERPDSRRRELAAFRP